MGEQISEAFCRVVELAEALGVSRINELDGCWEYQVDDQWFIAINAHKQDTKTTKGVSVKPFTMYVEFNGWPAGIVSPHGGIIAAGSRANEDTFIAALEAARDRAKTCALTISDRGMR